LIKNFSQPMTLSASQTSLRVPFFDLDYDESEERAILEVLQSKWISMGPRTEEFEKRFAQALGAKHAVAVSNCTAALHLSMILIGVGPGDEVVVPSLTFVATAACVKMVGAKPVFADVSSLDDWRISPREIEDKITPRTKAIIPMHYGGEGADMKKIMEIAREKKLFVVEDACHAPLGEIEGGKLGTFGELGCFSFYSNKNLSTGEGGMLVTDSDEYAERARLLRAHGMTTSARQRHEGQEFYEVLEHGFNYRMDDLRSCLGLVQLEKLPERMKRRSEIASRYHKQLSNQKGLRLPENERKPSSVHHLFTVLLDEGIDRAGFRAHMRKLGVDTSMHYPPVHMFTGFNEQGVPLPVTEEVGKRSVSLPIFNQISNQQIDYVCDSVSKTLKELS
tara:strand:- start:4124 stop:5299 length:1176 start_codon:yes stop_codon:yes gene_type:complete